MRVFQSQGIRVWALLTIVCGFIAVQGLWPAGTEAQTTTRVSVATGGGQANGRSSVPAVSDDGRIVLFTSDASNLVPGDTNGLRDVFVHDRQTGMTTRVSVSTGGGQSNGVSSEGSPVISRDGRIVAFDSLATNLVPGDTNAEEDVFVHDRQTGVTTRVSVATGGIQVNGGGAFPALSGDGRFVAFASGASDLVPGDTNSVLDVFVHDRQTGVTERVSVGPGGVQGNQRSGDELSVSGDGRFVAFISEATNLVPGDTNGVDDVFVHDRQTGTTTRVSVGPGGLQANGGSDDGPGISADGRFVAFISEATNLVAGDTNGVPDIFVHDRQTGITERVSVATGGQQANAASESMAISGDGRFVAIDTEATNLVLASLPNAGNGSQVYVHDRQTGTTTLVSVATGGGLPNDSGETAALSGNGRFVTFESHATNLVPGDTNGVQDVFVHDRGAGAVGDPNNPDVNGDGRADVVWRNLTNGATHVWQMTANGTRGPVTFPGGLPLNWVIQDVADVNGDGRADFVWRNVNNGATHVWQMTAGALRGPVTFPGGLPPNWHIQAVADVNGDGRADVVWRNMTNGATHVWQMTANGTRGPVTFPGGLPTNWVIQDVADVNGDGRADFVWRNVNNGATHVWQMTAGALRGPVTFPGGLPLNWEVQP